jgi:hypothetical protein
MIDLRFKDYFLYTQHSISTFETCPMKFKLRYLDGLKWENFPDENIKSNIMKGIDFHLLAYRYFMGISSSMIDEEELKANDKEISGVISWLKKLEAEFEIDSNALYLPEFTLRMTDSVLKIEANYDLVVLRDNRIDIWDWKTRNEPLDISKIKYIKRKFENSFQTSVYMFVLWEQMAILDKYYFQKKGRRSAVENYEQISMSYWQPDSPHILAEIKYDKNKHEEARYNLAKKIIGIKEYNFDSFDKSIFLDSCKTCEFNWYCNNEKVDYNAIIKDDDFLETLSWEDI